MFINSTRLSTVDLLTIVLSLVAIVISIVSIGQSNKLSRTQWELDWRNNYREAVVSFLSSMDENTVGEIANELIIGNYKSAMERGLSLTNALNVSSTNLNYIISDGIRFSEESQIEKLQSVVNTYSKDYISIAQNIVQFAIILNDISEIDNSMLDWSSLKRTNSDYLNAILASYSLEEVKSDAPAIVSLLMDAFYKLDRKAFVQQLNSIYKYKL